MAGKERNTKFWQKKFTYKNGKEIASIIPKFLLKEGSGWRKIENPDDVIEIFAPFIANSLASDLELYNVWVHESDGAFGKGIYEKFIESAKSQLKDKFKSVLYDAGIPRDSKISWFRVKELLEKELQIKIKENYIDSCIDIIDEVIKEIEEKVTEEKPKKK